MEEDQMARNRRSLCNRVHPRLLEPFALCQQFDVVLIVVHVRKVLHAAGVGAKLGAIRELSWLEFG